MDERISGHDVMVKAFRKNKVFVGSINRKLKHLQHGWAIITVTASNWDELYALEDDIGGEIVTRKPEWRVLDEEAISVALRYMEYMGPTYRKRVAAWQHFKDEKDG